MNTSNLEQEYIDLWKMREMVISEKPKMGWDAFFESSRQIRKAIDDYFSKIAKLEQAEKIAIHTKLNSLSAELSGQDDLMKRIIKQHIKNKSGGLKNLLNVYNSTSSSLTNNVKLIDYDIRKEVGHCNCALKQEIGLNIQSEPFNGLIELQKFNDGYYEYELHQCRNAIHFG